MAQARTTSASRHPPRPLPSPFPFPSTQQEVGAGPAAGSVSWMGLSRSPPPAVGTEMESPCPGLKFWAGMSYSREEVAQLRSQQCPLGTPHSPKEQPRASPAGLGLTQWARKAITRRWSEHGQRFHCLNPQIKLPSHSTASRHGQKHTKSQAEEPRGASAPSSSCTTLSSGTGTATSPRAHATVTRCSGFTCTHPGTSPGPTRQK